MTRGHLRIYLGAAPGVGKTCAMLDEGRRRLDRGTDVVIGYVEAHGRPGTTERMQGLEVVPRRRLGQGTPLDEMDVDAVLARRPAVALVDELAHTNVVGSRNEKRWQDVQELIDAGIEVITTLNIQHLESVHDVVERITGVAPMETVPDEVVRAADQVELVDMSPEALRRRLAHGNIYDPEQVDAALADAFRVGNLAALRELALLWVADDVDDSLQDYMEAHGIDHVWDTRERVVVAMTGAPSGDHLIRRASRMARRGHGDLIGVHIRSSDALATDVSPLLARHRALVKDLGGQYHEVVGADVAESMLAFARSENATQLVLGATRRTRWSELVGGSVINKVIRSAGEIDVHVISDPGAEPAEAQLVPRLLRAPRGAALPPRREAAGWLLAAVGIPLLTLLLAQLRSDLNLVSDMLLYLLLVCAVAAIGGWRPAVSAAVLASLTVNWFFTDPQHTFTIAELENTLALVVFLAVAVLLSVFVTQASRRQHDAQRARAEAEALARIAGDLAGDEEPLPEMLDQIRSTFDLDAAAVLRRTADAWTVVVTAGQPAPAAPDDGEVVDLGDDAVLVLVPGGLAAEDRDVLDAFADQLTTALEQRRLRAAAAAAETAAEADQLRTAILRAVSHDLRTPLASIKASSTSLLSGDIAWSEAQQRDFVETIDEEADRLDRLIGNLLDMSRIESGTVAVSRRRVGLEEVVGLALASLGDPHARVDVTVPVELPLVVADAALLERVVANLVRNALLHGSSAHPVRVEGAVVGEQVVLRVVDRGPGIPPEQRQLVFGPFQGVREGSSTGVGLGLAVARGFVEAMDGRLELDDTPGGGLTATVSLPVAPTPDPPPPAPPAETTAATVQP